MSYRTLFARSFQTGGFPPGGSRGGRVSFPPSRFLFGFQGSFLGFFLVQEKAQVAQVAFSEQQLADTQGSDTERADIGG